MSRSLRAGLLALLGLGLGLSGCGYSAGVRLPAEAQTVGVAVFENSTPFPQVERDLFVALSDQAARMVQAEVATPDRADVTVRGTILEYRRLYGVVGIENELQQTGVLIRLQAWLEDNRIGERIGDAVLFDQAVRYVIRVGEEEEGARREALAQLGQEILLDLFNQTDYLPESERVPDPNAQPDLPSAPLDPTAPPATDP